MLKLEESKYSALDEVNDNTTDKVSGTASIYTRSGFYNQVQYSPIQNWLEFQKARISETQKGYTISTMINRNRILTDENYLNTDVKNQIIDLVGESRLSVEVEIERLGERILSNEPISPILAKCIEVSKKIEVNPDYVLWLKNELYGYLDYVKDKPNISEPTEFPNYPDYRKLHGEIWLSTIDEETGKRGLETFDKAIFLSQSAAEIEGLIDSGRNSREFIFFMPTDMFPKAIK